MLRCGVRRLREGLHQFDDDLMSVTCKAGGLGFDYCGLWFLQQWFCETGVRHENGEMGAEVVNMEL